MLRRECNNFALDVQLLPNRKRKDFGTSHHLETMKYEVRNKTLSLKRLNHRNAADPPSVFRATGKLHAMCHAKQQLKKYILFFPLDHYRVCYLSPSREAFNLIFCLVYITVTSSPSVLEWAWHKRKVLSRISGGFDPVSWTELFFHVPEM